MPRAVSLCYIEIRCKFVRKVNFLSIHRLKVARAYLQICRRCIVFNIYCIKIIIIFLSQLVSEFKVKFLFFLNITMIAICIAKLWKFTNNTVWKSWSKTDRMRKITNGSNITMRKSCTACCSSYTHGSAETLLWRGRTTPRGSWQSSIQ